MTKKTNKYSTFARENIGLIIFIILGIAIVFTYSPTPSEAPIEDNQVSYFDCGDSEECFSEKVKTCTPAISVINQPERGNVYQQTIEGFDGDDCILKLKYIEAPVEQIVNKDMTCRIPKAGLADHLSYLQGAPMLDSCEGPLIDLIIQSEKL